MEIILTSYVEGLGAKGDIVEVKPNFAYNKLILPKLGVYKTPENIEKFASKKEAKDEIEHSSPFAPKVLSPIFMINQIYNFVDFLDPKCVRTSYVRSCNE